MNSELIEKLEDECQAKASRIKKLEAELDLGMETMVKAESTIYTLIRHRGMLERALIMLRNASLKYKMDKDDLEIEDANSALDAVWKD